MPWKSGCPEGTTDTGTDCRKDIIPRKVAGGLYTKPCSDWNPGYRDDGTVCWSDTKLRTGRTPDKSGCPAGSTDEFTLGTDCYRYGYDRGVGRPAGLKGCNEFNSNYRDDNLGSCWEDLKTTCDPLGWNSCKSRAPDWLGGGCIGGATGGACRSTGCGCIKIPVWDRYKCNSDEDLRGAVCYPKCKTGFYSPNGTPTFCEVNNNDNLVKRLADRFFCKENEDLALSMCYPKCGDKYTWNDAVPGTCIPKEGGGRKVELADRIVCQSGTKIGALCYENCPSGYSPDVSGLNCTPNDGIGVKKSLADRSFCPNNKRFEDSRTLCYDSPRNGFNCNAQICSMGKELERGEMVGYAKSCANTTDDFDGLLCYSKPKELVNKKDPNDKLKFTCDVTSCRLDRNITILNPLGVPKSCPDGKELVGAFCYDKPKKTKKPDGSDEDFKCDVTSCYIGRDNQIANPLQISDVCNSDKVMQNALCYAKPKKHKTPEGKEMDFTCNATSCYLDRDGQTPEPKQVPDKCYDDRVKQNTLCYEKPKKYKEGDKEKEFNCDTTACSISKKIKQGKFIGLVKNCTGDKDSVEDGLCYKTPENDFKCVATLCSKPYNN